MEKIHNGNNYIHQKSKFPTFFCLISFFLIIFASKINYHKNNMKRLLILFTLMLTLSTAKAQSEQQPQQVDDTHMKFMGIPMDCDVETFAKRLVKQKGLERDKYGTTDQIILKGKFSGYNNCFFILPADNVNKISSIGVILPMNSSFQIVKTHYQTLKNRLITKYGTPTREEEGFGDYEPSTDFSRIREIREGNAKFETTFVTAQGLIKIQIVSVDINGAYVQLIYYDEENASKRNDDTLDDL